MVKIFDYGPGDRLAVKNSIFIRFDMSAEATVAEVSTTMPNTVDMSVP